jgi:hypothetical protein
MLLSDSVSLIIPNVMGRDCCNTEDTPLCKHDVKLSKYVHIKVNVFWVKILNDLGKINHFIKAFSFFFIKNLGDYCMKLAEKYDMHTI